MELQDAGGTRLARYPFGLSFDPVDDGSLASFLCTVPADARAASVVVVHGYAPVVSRSRSAHAPTASFTQPAPGLAYRGDVAVAWQGQDADGDALTYQLLFSADAGSTWEPLLLDTPATSFTLKSSLVGNSRDVRLRLVVSDGFNSSEALRSLALNNPLEVLSIYPADGAHGVSTLTTVEARLRDPLDPAAANDALTLFDRTGHAVPAGIAYDPLGGGVTLTPGGPLNPSERYEARLSGSLRTTDGRTLGQDRVWYFRTRGPALFLPALRQSGNARPATPLPTDLPTRAPTRPPGAPSPTAIPQPSSPIPFPSATEIAATAVRPTSGLPPTLPPTVPMPTATPSMTASPLPVASPSPSATASAVAVVVAVDGMSTTGSDAAHMRTAFAPGEAIRLWMHASNTGASSATAQFEFSVAAQAVGVVSGLTWSGPLAVPAGGDWFSLDRTVPASITPGSYTFSGKVTYAGQTSVWTSELYLASSLSLADDFGDPNSGWTSGNDAAGAYGYLDGELRMTIASANHYRWISPPTSPMMGNFVVEADARSVGTVAGTVGLVFGIISGGGDYYVYQTSTGGSYSVYHGTGGGWETILSPRATPLLRSGNATNHLMLVRRSGLTYLYANGRSITMLTDVPAQTGRVGLYAASEQAGFEARFDTYRLFGLP